MGSLLIGGVIVAALILSSSKDEPEPEPETDSEPDAEPEPEPEPDPSGFAPVPDPEDTAADVVDHWLSDTPKMGALYLVQQNDNQTSVARQALGVNPGHPDIVPYMRRMIRVAWNFSKYATPWDPTSGTHQRYSVIVEGRRWVLTKAFLPRHKNAIALLSAGDVVPRNIKKNVSGSRIGTGRKYALLWLPSDEHEEPPEELQKVMRDVYVNTLTSAEVGP